MPDHTGRRRKQSDLPLGRISMLMAAIVAIGILVWLPEPRREQPPAQPLAPAPARVLPESFTTTGTLPDGAPYTPRLFLTAETSVGTAPSPDAAATRLVVRTGSRVTTLRTIDEADAPQFAGFAVDGDTIVWAESHTRDGAALRTTLWRANWRKSPAAETITSATGEPNFYGGQFDLVLHDGRVFWASASTQGGTTEVKSIPVRGGSVTTTRLSGEFALTAWPQAVSVDGGRGRPVLLVNYDTGARQTLPTGADETVTCASSWCRIAVLGDQALDRLELVRPDGSQRRRIAGDEATPTIVDVALSDRYVPLSTDRGAGGEPAGAGLSLYDIITGETHLLATDAERVAGNGAMLWWSTGSGVELTWHAIDLRTLA